MIADKAFVFSVFPRSLGAFVHLLSTPSDDSSHTTLLLRIHTQSDLPHVS